jgi:hypothetical protein
MIDPQRTIKEKARRMLEAAKDTTPGEWLVDLTDHGVFYVKSAQGRVIAKYARVDVAAGKYEGLRRGDARYIAAANPESVSEVCRAYLELLEEREKEEEEEEFWTAWRQKMDVRCVDCGLRYGEREEYPCAIEGRAHRFSPYELEAARREDA